MTKQTIQKWLVTQTANEIRNEILQNSIKRQNKINILAVYKIQKRVLKNHVNREILDVVEFIDELKRRKN